MMEKLNFRQAGMWAQSYDPRILAQMRVDTNNKSPGNQPDYDCPACLNRGFSLFLDKEGNMVSRECRCMTVRRCIWNMKSSGMETLLEKTFENFKAEQDWQLALLSGCREYLQQPDRWLLLCGQSGSGKTHLCSAVCRELLQQEQTVVYMLWRDASARLRDMNRDAQKREEEKEQYKQAPVLFIDDLLKVGGNAPPASSELSLAFEIINSRYNAGLRTVLSTELTPRQLAQLDEALCGRIVEKAEGFVFCVDADKSKNRRMLRRK